MAHEYQNLDYKILNDNDVPEIWELIKAAYIPHDPIYQYLEISSDECRGHISDDIEEYVCQGNSLGAFDRDGILRGLTLVPDSPNYDEKYENFLKSDLPRKVKIANNPLWDLYLAFYRKYGESNKFLVIGKTCVHRDYSSRKILKSLLDRTYDRVKEKNYDLMMGISSGEYSYTACVEIGTQLENAVEYSTYIDPLTKKRELTHIKPPHTHARLVIKPNHELQRRPSKIFYLASRLSKYRRVFPRIF